MQQVAYPVDGRDTVYQALNAIGRMMGTLTLAYHRDQCTRARIDNSKALSHIKGDIGLAVGGDCYRAKFGQPDRRGLAIAVIYCAAIACNRRYRTVCSIDFAYAIIAVVDDVYIAGVVYGHVYRCV